MAEDVFRLVGTVVDGRYRVDEVVGEGGFGVVYRGWHERLHSAIAIKCLKLPPDFTQEERKLFLANFRNEARLLNDLSPRDPAIVRVYDFGETQNAEGARIPYLVLEWLVGRDLSSVLAERIEQGHGPFSEREAIAFLSPAIAAVAVAHAAASPVAHRDLNPRNLFLAGSSLKVLDFGIAKVMQQSETATRMQTHTKSSLQSFSPDYGAPEQFATKQFGATGPWTDVHALGLILVELVTGKVALEGDNLYAWLISATSEQRPTPRLRAPGVGVSNAFEAVCQKALALRSVDRYRSAGELLSALEAVVNEQSRASPMAGSQAPRAASLMTNPS